MTLLTTPKVALIGMERDWVEAPFHDPTWTIWAPVFTHHVIPRTDVWFELHRPEWYSQPKRWCHCEEGYQGWLLRVQDPLVMHFPSPLAPTAQRYPLEQVEQAVGPLSMTGTIEWMAALAITLGAQTIGYFGVWYRDPHEEYFQRPGADYWIGYARGRGIEVVLPDDCPLAKGRLPGHYGPDYPPWPAGRHPDEWSQQLQLQLQEEGA